MHSPRHDMWVRDIEFDQVSGKDIEKCLRMEKSVLGIALMDKKTING